MRKADKRFSEIRKSRTEFAARPFGRAVVFFGRKHFRSRLRSRLAFFRMSLVLRPRKALMNWEKNVITFHNPT